MSASSSNPKGDRTILADPVTWDNWLEETRASVPRTHWTLFDPDSNAVMLEPIAPVLVEEPPPEEPENNIVRAARLARNQREDDQYYKRYSLYRDDKKDWSEYQKIESKLQERIISTVAPSKRAPLRTIYSVRQWLTELRNSTALPAETIKQGIQSEYQKLMTVALADWPSGGPNTWLGKWEKIHNDSIQFDEPLRTWLRDVCQVWERVPDLTVYISNIKLDIQRGNTAAHTPTSVASTIQWHWQYRKQGLALRVSKPKTTRSAFTTQEAATAEDANEPAASEVDKPSEKSKKKKGNGKRKRANENPPSTSSNVAAATNTSSSGASIENRSKKPKRHCTACGVDGHTFSKCYLVVEEPDKDWVNRETFDNNMKVPSFRKKVTDFQGYLDERRRTSMTVRGWKQQEGESSR